MRERGELNETNLTCEGASGGLNETNLTESGGGGGGGEVS